MVVLVADLLHLAAIGSFFLLWPAAIVTALVGGPWWWLALCAVPGLAGAVAVAAMDAKMIQKDEELEGWRVWFYLVLLMMPPVVGAAYWWGRGRSQATKELEKGGVKEEPAARISLPPQPFPLPTLSEIEKITVVRPHPTICLPYDEEERTHCAHPVLRAVQRTQLD